MKRPPRHGTARGKQRVALLLIDVINDLDFPEAEQLLPQARLMARRLVRLKARCREKGIPTIYANDNFGRWRSDFRAVVAHCMEEHSRGRPIVEQLLPDEEDFFVLKPLHSGFYSTTLDILLTHLRVNTLIVTGIATDICVLFTANDAYMRGFQLIVPRDCVAANHREASRLALEQMATVLDADTRPSRLLRLERQHA